MEGVHYGRGARAATGLVRGCWGGAWVGRRRTCYWTRQTGTAKRWGKERSSGVWGQAALPMEWCAGWQGKGALEGFHVWK